jgi:hypothetical protein
MSASLKPSKTDLKELQAQQVEADGDFSASKEAKRKGNVDSSYELAEHSAHRIHLQLSRKVNDPVKKEYTEQKEVVELSPQQYERMKSNNSFAGFTELLGLIAPLEDKLKAKSTTGGEVKKPMRSLEDAQERYQALVGKPAPADKNYTELKQAITHYESPEGAADLEDAKAA